MRDAADFLPTSYLTLITALLTLKYLLYRPHYKIRRYGYPEYRGFARHEIQSQSQSLDPFFSSFRPSEP